MPFFTVTSTVNPDSGLRAGRIEIPEIEYESEATAGAEQTWGDLLSVMFDRARTGLESWLNT